ncbi:MAG: transposase [Elusimicrobia bacterium]|nr:transposase [Elusimicrobiota bacterium]
MPRIARVVDVGMPHHITQRGNYCQPIFGNNKDRLRYLSWIREYSDKFGLHLLAYCLMNNHVHFIVIPTKENSLSQTFSRAHMRYSQYFNTNINMKGHLWQGRFYSCALDSKHLIVAARYVERNPVRAGLVKNPWEWEWSSNRINIYEKTKLFDFINTKPSEWKKYTALNDDKPFMDEIRNHTKTGRPLGNIGFIARLEKKTGKVLRTLPRGRPIIIQK